MNKRRMKKIIWIQLANDLMAGGRRNAVITEQLENRHRITSAAAKKRLRSAIESVQKDCLRKSK